MNKFEVGMWTGATVAVVSNVEGMSADQVAAVRADRVIAVNRAVVHAPGADMMVSIDGNWPDAPFSGIRVVGVPGIDGAQYVSLPYEVVGSVEMRNNAISAIRLAEQAGATRIVLVGFNTDRYEQIHNFPHLTRAMGALIAELGARGVQVEFAPAVAAEQPRKRR